MGVANSSHQNGKMSTSKKVDFKCSSVSPKSGDTGSEYIFKFFGDTELRKDTERYKKLTVATMLRENGVARMKEDKKTLRPDDCYLIWATTLVGKFGAFYEAAEGQRLKPVTIKVYRPKLFGRNGSEIEKRILSHTPKPYVIPRLLRSFRYDFQNVLILQRIEMYPLQYRLWNYLRFNHNDAMMYFCEMVSAVGFLHSLNVIHRSLFLGSFWVQSTGHLKLIDYTDCVETERAYHFKGKPVSNYTAPEMMVRGTHTKMVDIWALGVLLFRMITGFMPFRGHTRKETIDMIKYRREVYSLSLFPETTALLCNKMLQKDPSMRFAYGTSTMVAFNNDPAFVNVKWARIFDEPFYPGELLCAEPIYTTGACDSALDNKCSITSTGANLDLMTQTDLKFGRRKKPLRFDEITTRKGSELFDETLLLRQSDQQLNLNIDRSPDNSGMMGLESISSSGGSTHTSQADFQTEIEILHDKMLRKKMKKTSVDPHVFEQRRRMYTIKREKENAPDLVKRNESGTHVL